MSLNAALLNSLSGLQTTQQQIDVASRNLVNATTPGYTRKTREQLPMVVAGQGQGVDLGRLSRTVDAGVQRSMRESTSRVAGYETAEAFHTRFETMFGKPGDEGSLSGRLNALGTAFDALSVNPEVPVNQMTVINAAENVVQTLHGLYAAADVERGDARAQLTTTVERINDTLGKIDQLNAMISSRAATRQETADIEDQRDILMDSLAADIDYKYFTRENNQVVILTSAGQVMLDDEVNTLSLDPSGNVTQTVRNEIRTLTFSAGRVSALQTIINDSIPTLQQKLDEVARAVTDELAAIDLPLFNVGGTAPLTPPDVAGYGRTIAVNDAIKADLTLLRGTPPTEIGDDTVALAAAALFSRDDIAFGAGLSATGSLAGAGAQVITGFANDKTNITLQRSYQTTLQSSLQKQLSDQSGVNIDQELSTTIVLQTSYMAATRMVQTTQKLFDALFEMV